MASGNQGGLWPWPRPWLLGSGGLGGAVVPSAVQRRGSYRNLGGRRTVNLEVSGPMNCDAGLREPGAPSVDDVAVREVEVDRSYGDLPFGERSDVALRCGVAKVDPASRGPEVRITARTPATFVAVVVTAEVHGSHSHRRRRALLLGGGKVDVEA